MIRRCLPACLAVLSVACAETGTLLNADVPTLNDVAPDDVADAADVPDVDFDVPRFDLPPPRDVAADEAIVDTPDTPDVPPDVAPRRIDHCYLVDPRVMNAAPGATSATLTVAVFVASVTSGAGRGPDVTVDIGVGPGATLPLDTTSMWTWTPSAYERDIDGRGATGARDYDQYTGSLTAPTMASEYAYAARARVGTGPYTACDFVQSMPHAYNPAFAGRLTVATATATRVGYCNLQFPRTLSVMASATAAMPVYGRVYASGLTNRGCADTPTAVELSAQWGYGPDGSFPSTATWTWIDGAYSAHRDSTMPLGTGNCANVEYQATPRAPVDCASRSYGWRFRVGTGPWTYCRWAPPADGAPATPPFDTWDATLAGTMAVTGCL